ncbi:hypothetical protein N7462_001018 [Penicillium macrosclerotiorum]|uniref:uncharacterized protein n=1 Tax=Penicillium macrosclerotiorum TaxID=303699 RepID=UPI0025474A67|nr:uncharacterized protein N7462_001018 [Penicillium macrosclerotiorum]KAJ5699013.1 hypothetical protein N7462_001018 [Penicillium macrosclerotiorum]
MLSKSPDKPLREDENQVQLAASHAPATSGTTLLPRPVASLVSFIAQSTSLSLRVGTFFGGVALNGARTTTLTGLELGRAVVEGILTRAGRDVAIRSSDEHGRIEAESLLERSLATLHTTVTSASFFAAATFHFSSTTLASVANFSQALLSTLDAILGSTESSRAIAAIITLIRREFRSVDPGTSAETVGVGDLLIGSVGFALLQRWGKKNTERTIREKGGDEVVWDTVILDNGLRADVVGTHQVQFATRSQEDLVEPESASFVMPGNGDEAFDAVHRRSSVTENFAGSRLSLSLDGQQQVSDEDIRSYIVSQLPPGCHASIKSEVLTARTITVDIFDDDMAEIAPPPGTTMIEERFHHDHQHTNAAEPDYQRLPKHTMVFRTAFNKSQSTQLRPYDGPIDHSPPEPSHTPWHAPIPPSPEHTGSQHDRTRSHPDSGSDTIVAQHDANSDSIGEQSQKPGLRKTSFTKFAQRVKPNGSEKSDIPKRLPPKKPSIKPPSSSGSANTRPLAKPVKGSASAREVTARELSNRSELKRRPNETAAYRPATPAPNRALRRSPFPGSPQSPQSPRVQTKPITGHHIPDRTSSRAGYFAVREQSQESLLTHTDTFSRRNRDMRPGSPVATRAHVRSSSSLSVTHSETDGTLSVKDHRSGSPALHRRSQSYTPSMYSVATAGSDTSLILAHRPRNSAYEEASTIQALNRDGVVPGIFPERHFVQNIRRFCRFSSASYGASALKVMGVHVHQGTNSLPHIPSDRHEHSAFSNYAGLPPSTILLSSFVDPSGGSNAAGETESGFPLVHYLSIDHESKAVVLTLRGTWGFEDILTDMTCDYDDLEWQGKNWKVHKGMHSSAIRLLEGGGGRVMITLRAALEEFNDYGVVLCGHSLGGGVAALLATMISEPSNDPIGTSFVTASYQLTSRPRLLNTDTDAGQNTPTPALPAYDLPPGRPIHVYAYGPPAVMSPFLRLATRGLITTIVNGQDVVPSLSLGILHDMHTASLAFKSDITGAKSHVRHRLHESLRQSIIHKFYVNQPPHVINAGDGVGEDAWAWKTLRQLRDEMRAPKLVPPGEVFVVETMRVLQRDAFTPAPDFAADAYPRLGRPATRVQMRFIRDVNAWFGELRFASGMLSDHNPARYETSLAALARGVLDE